MEMRNRVHSVSRARVNTLIKFKKISIVKTTAFPATGTIAETRECTILRWTVSIWRRLDTTKSPRKYDPRKGFGFFDTVFLHLFVTR